MLKFNSEHFTMKDVYINIDINGIVKGNVIDLSMNGIGFEFTSINMEQIEFIKNSDNIFLKLFIRELFILIGVKLVWSLLKNENGADTFNGGFTIHTISPDDNIRLSELIETMRSSKSK